MTWSQLRLRFPQRFRALRTWAGSRLVAHQEYSTRPFAFVWDATTRVRGLPFYGLDHLSEDGAVFSGRLAGLLKLFSGSDREVRRASMLRYLSESIWFPQVLAGDEIRWEEVDPRRARALLTAGGETVEGVFEFDEEPKPVAFSAMRPRDVNGKSVPTMWRGELWEHVRVDGVEIPSRAKVSWMLEEGPFTYWEARIEGLRFWG
ncbi:MAG: DUF6544 family protein [Myxococcota bacterium]